jgi:hypothetical protein
MAIEYKILLKIELLSDYFTDEKSRHLQIVPTAACARLLQSQNILYRQLSNKFILMAKVDSSGKPFTAIDPAAIFRFYLKIEDYPFLQYTSLPFDPASDRRYYFSNLNNNVANGKKYISGPFDVVYNNTLTYNPGDRVLNNLADKEMFEAVRKSSNANQHALNENQFWFKRTTAATPKQYVNATDLLTMTGRAFNFRIAAPATTAGVSVFGFNTTTNAFDLPAQPPVSLKFEEGVQDIPVDLSKLPSARYKVVVSYNGTDESRIVYSDEMVFENGVLGIIDIHNSLPAASGYAFLDNTGKIKESPEVMYTLRFASRIAFWRYVARTDSVKDVKEKTSTHSFAPDGPLKFRSANPLLFSEKPFNILIDYKKDNGSPNIEIEGMKNGSYQNLRQIELAPEEKFDCSEIYLNY